ncbi:family 43 glycosylhydrolase [Micromonospora sp. NBC_01655]|uniref:family 43 glycosylhydrolase n=1 Tax=Micromonospora sp. NBC_01655 TaxID=2975983 RepID=UPI0022505483|nr:family 43 glycosylhydrolase [Micromonospora sp. NBC_01655]MCX4471613.1 family 43 glycosylhydrolase [Micromonospora sp. NBC_01655]
MRSPGLRGLGAHYASPVARAVSRLTMLALVAALLSAVTARPAAADDDPVRSEGEALPVVSATAPVQAQADCCGVSWSAGRQLWFRAARAGDSVTVALPQVPAGQYDIGAVLTRAPDYGRVRFAIDGVAVGQLFDGYAPNVQRTGAVPVGAVSLAAGSHHLSITVTGRSASSAGLFVGLDTLTLRRVGPLASVTSTPYELVGEAPVRGALTRVYDPGAGQSTAWYYNDHTIVRDQRTGLWHVFAITHPEPGAPQDEKTFGHATAPSPTGPWTRQPVVLTADPAAGERWIWAPHVVYDQGVYYMFYAAGNPDLASYRMHLATSTDLFTWTRSSANPLFVDGWEARDPMVTRVGDRWVMYYTATSSPTGGNHVVAYRTSTDLRTWSARGIAYASSRTGQAGGQTESPFVVRRGDWYYLFVCCDGTDYGAAYRRTAVYRSRDPIRFEGAEKVAVLDAHAAEVVVDGANWYLSHAGWGQGGLWLAPLTWSSGVVARGRTVTTGFLRADVRTWPSARLASLALDPAGGGAYRAALDSSHRGTGPYLAVGGFDVTDRAGSPARVDVSADGSRLHLVGIPFGDEPVTADWLLTVAPRWSGPALQSDVTWSVNGPTTAGVWEVAFNVDGAGPSVGDPPVAARPTGDVTGLPNWTMTTGNGLSVVAAHRWASAWRGDNTWYDSGHAMAAWQPLWRSGGTTWPTGQYPGGTWRFAASATNRDVGFADTVHAALNAVP